MRCKKHLPDLTSSVGVCASCLRERLQAVLDAEIKAQAQAQSSHRRFGKPDLNPTTPPPNFLRQRERLFDSTQQAGRDVSSACDVGTALTKRKFGKFWILSNVFRSRSNKTQDSSCKLSSSVTPPSSTWFSTVLPDRREKHGVTESRKIRQSEIGSSTGNNVLNDGQNQSASGYSSESTPQRAAMAARRSRLGPAGKSLASMALCLSPLVRASPNRHWNSHKGMSQELSVGGTHQLSDTAAFCANRSRKLADFGRVVAYNR